MPKYVFADRRLRDDGNSARLYTWCVGAKTPDQAFDLFRALVLFPEPFVDPEHKGAITAAHGSSRYQDGQPALDPPAVHTEIPDEYRAEIPVFVVDPADKRHPNYADLTEVARFPYRDAVFVTGADLLPHQHLLAAPEAPAEPGTDLVGQGLTSTAGPAALRPEDFVKVRSRQAALEVAQKRAEMERMEREMSQMLARMQTQMRDLSRKVYLLSTFLGTEEEVVLVRDGDPAPAGTPLTLYQQVVYMDEEVGIWEDGGLDHNDLASFDTWAATNLDRYLYEPLSVAAFQVRRRPKKREATSDVSSLLASLEADALDRQTYFVFRNGDRVYRVWSNVQVHERLFPTLTEFQEVLESRYGGGEKAVEQAYQSYLPGVLYVQGVIERTDVLGDHLRGEVNLLRDQENPLVRFVRDAEPSHWLGDGRPRWREFIEANQAGIAVGTRVLCLVRGWEWYEGAQGEDRSWRSQPAKPSNYPDRSTPYVVTEAQAEDDRDSYYGWAWDFRFLYHPGDTVWTGSGWDATSKPRSKRVGWRVSHEEVVDLDAITLSDIDYYLRSRLDRPYYLEVLPTLQAARAIKREEREAERPFADLVYGRLDEDQRSAVSMADVWETIDWWKGKVRLPRAVSDDDAKALRMVEGRLRRLAAARAADQTESTYALVHTP